MQHVPLWLLVWQWCAAVLGIGMHAAAGLPVLIALGLLTGRRGHARMCVLATRRLLNLNLKLAPLGPLLTAGALTTALIALRGTENIFGGISPWSPGVQPYTAAALAWLAGIGVLLLLRGRYDAAGLPPAGVPPEKDLYPTGAVRSRLLLALLAMLTFYAAQACRLWPFGGLPQGMSLEQAAAAVLSSAMHAYFTTFAPAGALALVLLQTAHKRGNSGFSHEQFVLAARWCAFWAMIGYLPRCLDRWGTVIGVGLRDGPWPAWLTMEVAGLVPLTLAIGCWAVFFAMRAPLRLLRLNGLALFMLVVRESMPFLILLADATR